MSDEPPLVAYRYEDGSLACPGHPRGPAGDEPVDELDLSAHTGEVVTFTVARATPPGVRAPNPVAIVEFTIEGETVRAIGQLTTETVSIGDTVTPVYTAQLRDPEQSLREPASQDWDGYRFEPV